MGELSGLAPSDPLKVASPKAKMPPSDATIQYPRPSWVGAMPTMGSFRWLPPMEPSKDASPKAKSSVTGYEPVPAPVVGGGHADDR